MAQEAGGGGGGLSQADIVKLQYKDDTPVHKTDEFRETIRRIREKDDGRPITPSIEEKQPVQFNIPMPSNLRPQRRQGSSFNQEKYEAELYRAVRENVTKELPLPGYGVHRDEVEKRIEKETRRLIDVIKRPRTVFLSDDTPFFLSREDERVALERSLLNETPLKRRWMLAKYDIASGFEKAIRFIDEGSQTAKEYLTDTSGVGNVAAGIAQLGLNSVMLGVEYLRFGDQAIFASKEKADALRREAEAVKYTDPAHATDLLAQAADMEEGVKNKEKHNARLKLASDAFKRAWSTVVQEAKESNEFTENLYDPNMTDENGRQIMSWEQLHIYNQKKQDEAQITAASIRTQATTAYANGNYEQALALTRDAIEQDRLASGHDAYSAYTWMREPERLEKFMDDAALLELQKGSPLTKEEIRRLKEYHANSWTELTGEVAFDLTNLIPAVLLEKVLKVPLKTVIKVHTAVGEAVPAYRTVTNVMGKPVRWLLRESVQSGANKIARRTNNVFQRVSNAYGNSEEVVKAVDEISNAVLDAKRAGNENAARVVFEQARRNTPGLQQVTFQDFKHLMDAAEHVDPTEWGKIYSDALSRADEGLRLTASQTGKAVDDVVSDVSKNRWALEEVADKFSSAFKDPHRIFKGSRLTDDTLSGWITKKARALSGDELNELMKLTKNDEWLIEKSAKLGTKVKDMLKATTHFAEASLTFAAHVRDFWAMAVLTTFRWPINNLIDTSMRSVIYGGNLFDDLGTLFTSTQRTLADELGFSPLEFNNALSREGLAFTEQVPHRLLYENWRPKAGIFSYMGYEYKRLLAEHGDKAITKMKLTEKILEGLPDGAFKKNFAAVIDGMNYRVNVLTALRAMPGAIQDFNTAIEFTFRLRMFHREYFNLLKKLEPQFMERGMDALSPTTKEIAKQIWRAAEGNPRRITAYVDNLLGGKKNTPAAWSVLTPPGFDDTLKNMDIADRSLFVASVQNELDEFISTATRNGQELKGADFEKFFDDFKLKMQDEVQFRLSQVHDVRGIDGSIRTDGKPNNILTEDDIQGSMPIPKEVSPRNQQIEEAIGKLNRKKTFRKSVDIHTDFETAISEYAQVERVAGDGMQVTKRGNQIVIEVGDDLLKKNAKDYYKVANNAVISILKNQDTDLILRSGFASSDQYEIVMRKFFDDPTAVLNDNERHFLTLVNQMENHPNLRRIIEQTSPETVRKYDSALDLYRDIGEYSDVYGFNKRPDRIMMSEAEKIRPVPGSHVVAANEARITARQLIETSKSISPELESSVREFVGQLQIYRQELKQFYAFTFPGPLMRSTTEQGRHAGWDLFYRLSEAEFKQEAQISNKLIELLQKNPEEAKKFIQETNDNFAEYFLRENGIDLEWDADRQMIMNIRVKGLDGRYRNFTARRDIANLQIRFFSPQTQKAIEGAVPIRIAKDEAFKMRRDLTYALRDTFQIDTAHAEAWTKVIDNHAQKWAQETGQDIEKYYERLGFQRVDQSTAKGLGTMDQTRIVKRGAIKRAEDGTFTFYGLSQSNFESMVRETGELFYDDLVSMAEHSPQAADDLQSLKKFLESKTGKPIRANRLEQAHSDILSDTFSSYIATGHGPDIKIKNGFDRLKKWLTSTFDAVRDSKVAGEIPDETYRVLDRLFVEAQMFDVPKTNKRTIQLLAKEAGLIVENEDELLKVINNAHTQGKLELSSVSWTPSRPKKSSDAGGALSTSDTVKSAASQPDVPQVSVDATLPSDITRTSIDPSSTLGPANISVIGEFDASSNKIILQASNDIEENIRLAEAALPRLEALGKELEQSLDGVTFGGARIKDRSGIERKLLTRQPHTISDYAGGRLIFDDVTDAERVLQALEEKGILVNAENFMEHPRNAGYRAIHVQIDMGDGFTVELQLVPDEIAAVQKAAHKEYEIFRQPNASADAVKEAIAKTEGIFNEAWERWQKKSESIVASRNRPAYNDLGDVPLDVATRALGKPDSPLVGKITNEIQEGWEVWRTNRNLIGFPDDALTDPDTFKAYLRQRMGEEWSELGDHYNRMLWEVEQFEDAMLNYHAGDDLRTTLFPRVHEGQMSDGMRTYLRNTVKVANDYEISRRALDQWKDYLIKMADEGHPTSLLTKDEQAALKAWAYGDGSKAKAEMVSTILNGSDEVEGAIPLVNKRMLDYQSTNVLDQFMKNWFPFWMFPSRSLPFWAETLATHPQIIANYEKLQRLSRSQRYQAGAVTSKGKPLPSLNGYIQIPGTDTWFNPLAPFSFRYLLDIQKSKDSILYAAQSEDDIDPATFMASELMGMGQVYGFSLAPWGAWFIKNKMNIPDEIIPRYPLIPEIQLVPRWWVQEQIQRANQINLFGMDWNKHLNTVYPEVPWHDYMVERRILENALQKLQSGNLTQEQKNKLMSQAQNAIKYKGNDPLWEQTYKEITNDEAMRSQASFFTGMYAKEFGDGEADLLALRNEINLIKSSLNNEFQATVFDLPVDANEGWDNYLNIMDSPEGWTHRLYTDIGWVRNNEGELVRDPKERAIWLAKKIEMNEDQQMYYDKMADLQKQLQSELRSLPIGADWELVKGVFDRYAEGAESLNYLKTFERTYGSNKPVELIQQNIAQDWFRKLKATKPNWNVESGETYEEYQQRVMEWETNLPKIAERYMRAYSRGTDLNMTLNALQEDQQFNTDQFFNELINMSNKEGLLAYEKDTDDIFDALNKSWEALYWDDYWNSVIGKDGYEVDLAETDFYNRHPEPPTAEELYAWISNYYGPDKFTPDEIKKWVEGTDELDILQRQLQGQDDPEDYKKRQEIWDMLSWMGPGNKNRDVFNQAFANAGGDPDWLTTWYQESGQAYKLKPERLEQLHNAIQKAITDLGLQPPERAELVRYVQAQKENEMFQQLVNDELGKDFFDYTDEDGLVQQGIYSYYNALDYKARKEFRGDFPEEYDKIQSYYDMKTVFQDGHPTWADYYGFDTEPSVGLPVDPKTGSTFTPPSVRTFTGSKRYHSNKGGGKPEPRPTQTHYGDSDIPQFNIYDRTSNYVSPGLFDLAGNKLGWEITQLFGSGRRISTAGQSFLRSLASRYPQYSQEIQKILAKGS